LIDLDEVLRPWVAAAAPAWDAKAAQALATRAAAGQGLSVEWEPDDEEWVRLVGDTSQALISVRYPLALCVPALAGALAAQPGVRVVEISDAEAPELRASVDVLRATLLPGPHWAEDFDPDRFSAWDLFVESV
jgi:hypothetical protein